MDTHERLRQLLNERGWTEYRLAKNCGLSESTIANIYRRNTVPSLATLEAICKCAAFSYLAAHGDVPVGDVNHPLYKRKAQTVPLGGMGGIALIKLFKNMPPYIRADAAARIGHPDRSVLPLRSQAYGDAPARLGEFNGVGKQIAPNECQQLRVRLDPDILLNLRVDLQLLFFPHLFKGKQALTQLLSQIVRTGIRVNRLIFQLVEL